MTFLKLIAGQYPGLLINLDHVTCIEPAKETGAVLYPARVWLSDGRSIELTPGQFNKLTGMKFGYLSLEV